MKTVGVSGMEAGERGGGEAVIRSERSTHPGPLPKEEGKRARVGRAVLIQGAVVALLFVARPAPGATADTKTALQQGLFEEEANHNLDAAIQAYQAVVRQFDQDRKVAATAVFRLGECYRKQGHTNEANVQYERILHEFADQTPLVSLSRSYLATAGSAALAETASTGKTSSGESDEVRRIQAMIKDSPDLINSRDAAGQTPLHHAAESGQLVVATFLLENGAEVDAKDNSGRTPLLLATDRGHKEMMELLLAHGADVQTTQYDPQAPTALDVAASRGFRSLVELLLAHGAKVTAAVPNGVSALHLAALKGYKSVAEVLIQHGANVNELAQNIKYGPGQFSGTPLHIAAARGDLAMAELLLANKADPNLKPQDGNTPLRLAAAFGQEKLAQLLLDHGAQLNPRNTSMATPLASAVISQHVPVVKVLLGAKADPNLPFIFSQNATRTPLYVAVTEKNAELVGLLLEHGANPNIEDEADHDTPLLASTKRQLTEITALLLKANADPNTHDPAGQAPLHFSLTEPGSTELLLDHQAQVNAKDNAGETPLHWAAGAGLKSAAALLIERGANLNAVDKHGDTPLHFAVVAGRTEMTEFLLAKGADPNISDHDGQTPLDWVKKRPGGPWMWASIGPRASFLRPSEPGFPLAPPPLPASPGTPAGAESEQLAAALKSHGALEDLPHFDRIEVSRPAAHYSAPIFYKGTNNWNHFTALELIGVQYHLLSANPEGTGGERDTRGVWVSSLNLGFPDLGKVQIRQPAAGYKAWRKRIVDLRPALKSGDCSNDVNLAWGDVVEIPEADHPLNESWAGFADQDLTNLAKCLSRQVQVVIKGQGTNLGLGPKLIFSKFWIPGRQPEIETVVTQQPLWLKPALRQSNLLLASSDLSRIKVTRADKATGQKREWVLDCSEGKPAPEFWLRDGDVIEVPEKN